MAKGLEKKLNYSFRNKALLTVALTHPSVNKGVDNQRLEFLGDAVLGYCISQMLYHKYPQMPEGGLTERRAALVCEDTLCLLAQRLEMGEAMRLGHGEEQTFGRGKPSILADALEALNRQIEAAILGGLRNFAVVHGKGDGILCKGVQEYLKSDPRVAGFSFSRPELGGHGRTEVELK